MRTYLLLDLILLYRIIRLGSRRRVWFWGMLLTSSEFPFWVDVIGFWGVLILFTLSDSGAQYYDGTCDTTRTVHFGRPTPEMSEAYTRVLQGHVRFSFHFLFILYSLFNLARRSPSIVLFFLKVLQENNLMCWLVKHCGKMGWIIWSVSIQTHKTKLN